MDFTVMMSGYGLQFQHAILMEFGYNCSTNRAKGRF
jgi:hypothetical protein